MKTKPEVAHTPTPKEILGRLAFNQTTKADAAFIVRAVNSHGELVKAVEAMRDYVMDAYEVKGPTLLGILHQATQAIAKAEGK